MHIPMVGSKFQKPCMCVWSGLASFSCLRKSLIFRRWSPFSCITSPYSRFSTTVPFQLNSFKGEKRKNIEHMALDVPRVFIAIYCTSMLQFAHIQNMEVSEHANETGHVPVQDRVRYRIYSLIRRTIFYKKICLFDQNLLKTWVRLITKYFRATKYIFSKFP